MNTFMKTGILALLLVVPVLVYLFLKIFGTNHYRIAKYVPVDVIEKTANDKVIYDTLWHTIPPFQFIDQSGKKGSDTLLSGKIYVANFFFTRCPGI